MSTHSTGVSRPSAGVSRASPSDGLFITLAALHGALLVASPSVAVIALGLWWNANTISHNFIHRPFFRARSLNLLFAAYSTVLLGIPHRLWRDRHLAHHAGVAWRLRCSHQLLGETLLVCGFWIVLATANPRFFATVYLPGYGIGLVLCAIQGHYEHAGDTTSHYGCVYNVLCFNDGYHVEHHASPGTHWTTLSSRVADAGRSSRWPPLLRWIDDLHPANPMNLVNRVNLVNLEALERLVLRSVLLQRFVLRCHRRAFAALIPALQPQRPGRIAIVGGGLFPRSALILRELLPDSEIVIIDASAANIETARSRLSGPAELVCRRYSSQDDEWRDFDLVVIPLSFQGDREAVYRLPSARALLVHDWIWRARGDGRIISFALLKRLNLVRR